MNGSSTTNSTRINLDEGDEEILAYAVSDEALEAASGTDAVGRSSGGTFYFPQNCC
jgi:hypothetical protein